MQSPIKLIKTYASFVKFAHTVFALPFALTGMIVAYAAPLPAFVFSDQSVSLSHVRFWWPVLCFILVCMAGARTFAMGLNRIVDRRIDALNPRTVARELPSKRMSLTEAWILTSIAALAYFAACYSLGPVVLTLSPIPIVLMAVYPYTKRFTWSCHLFLGASLGLAPVGAWVAVRSANPWLVDGPYIKQVQVSGELQSTRVFQGLDQLFAGWHAVTEPLPWLLGGAVMLWVAGFDIIYALQDDEFDREHGLKSIPAKFGRKGALWISRVMHLVSAALFFAFVWLLLNPSPVGSVDMRQHTEIATWVWAAPCVMLAGMIYQHSLVKPNDLSRVNLAFFTVNGVISIMFGLLLLAAWLLF